MDNGLIIGGDSYNYLRTQELNFDELFTRFINYLDVSKLSVYQYKINLKRFFDFLKEHDIKQPTRQDILDYKNFLKSKEYKPTTVAAYIVAVKLFFQWLELENLYPDVSKRIKTDKISKYHKKDALTVNQTKNLLESIEKNKINDKRNYAMILLMITSGLRTIEVVKANLEDMRNLGNYTVLYIQSKSKNEKTDYVKLPFPVEAAIRDYVAAAKITNLKSPLFLNHSGNRLTTRMVRKVVKKYLVKSNLNDTRITTHSLRHTTATLNLINGGTLEETQQLLRHQNISTTMIYAHHLERLDNNSEDRVYKAIFS